MKKQPKYPQLFKPRCSICGAYVEERLECVIASFPRKVHMFIRLTVELINILFLFKKILKGPEVSSLIIKLSFIFRQKLDMIRNAAVRGGSIVHHYHRHLMHFNGG